VDRAGWAVEGCEEPISGRVDLAPAVASELPAYPVVVSGQELAPAAIAEFGCGCGCADDVREQDRCERTLGFRRPLPVVFERDRKEPLELSEQLLLIA
jgi:hypothetical protein